MGMLVPVSQSIKILNVEDGKSVSPTHEPS